MTRAVERRHRAPAAARRAGRAGRAPGAKRCTRTSGPGLHDAAPLCATLGDATGLRAIERLCDGGLRPIVRLTAGARSSRQAVTKHVQALQEVGLVHSDRAGGERIRQLNTRRLGNVAQYLEQIAAQWDGAPERLRMYVERAS